MSAHAYGEWEPFHAWLCRVVDIGDGTKREVCGHIERRLVWPKGETRNWWNTGAEYRLPPGPDYTQPIMWNDQH